MTKQELIDFAAEYSDVPAARDKESGWCFVRTNGKVRIWQDKKGHEFIKQINDLGIQKWNR